VFDSLDVAALEREIEELGAARERALAERAEVEHWIERAQAAAAQARERIPDAEATARERRRYRPEANVERGKLENALTDLIETEASVRMRREQAEQRALGFRSAEIFSGAARTDAEKLGDRERVQRERIVEDRARHEADLLEARARHERAEEERFAAQRAELEERVNAMRSGELQAAKEREEAEAILTDLRRDIALAQDDLERAQYEAARLDLEIARLAEARRAGEERLRVDRRQAVEALEEQISELRAAESDTARRRAETEVLLRRMRDDVQRDTGDALMQPLEPLANGRTDTPEPAPPIEPARAILPEKAPPIEPARSNELGITKLIFGLLGGKRR